MIKKIEFKNYKAFEKGEIKISPITILLGANSVGKSSIIQLILLLQQTALSNKYKSALKLHGEFVSLGENENLFKDKDTSNELIFTFQIESNYLFNLFKGELLEELIQSIVAPIEMLQSYFIHSSKGFKTIEIFTKESIEKAKKSKKDFLNLIKLFSSSMNTISIENKMDEEDLFLSFRLRELNKRLSKSHLLKNEENYTNYGNLYDILKSCEELKSNLFSISFNIKNIKTNKESILKVTNVSISNENKTIFKLTLNLNKKNKSYENIELSSDFIKNKKDIIDDKTKKELLENINFDSTIFYLFNNIDNDFFGLDFDEVSSVVNIINKIFYHSVNSLRKNFSRDLINYVSPLRAHPKRYYFLDKAKINTFLDTLDGDSLTEILKENSLVKRKVNNWLKNFNFTVDVSTLQDVIHKLKINQSGLELDITDVGFGISQVLPVIVQGFLSNRNSLTIVEQPEIHLHPTMQADLADLFIDIVFPTKRSKKTKFLLIETHSEYLLKRLRRRMSEKDKITNKDVTIYFFHSKNNKSSTELIEEKEINNEGAFDWPKSFYSGELLKDNIEFIKNQI